jgi:hypothetical protein
MGHGPSAKTDPYGPKSETHRGWGQCQSRNLICPGRDYKIPIYQESLLDIHFWGFRVFAYTLSLKHSLLSSLFLQNSAMTAQTQEELLAAHLEQQKIDVSLSLSLLIYMYSSA